MLKYLSIFLLSGICFGADLSVSVTGIRPELGRNVILFLYSKSTWVKLKAPTKAIPITADMKSTSFKLENISSGE